MQLTTPFGRPARPRHRGAALVALAIVKCPETTRAHCDVVRLRLCEGRSGRIFRHHSTAQLAQRTLTIGAAPLLRYNHAPSQIRPAGIDIKYILAVDSTGRVVNQSTSDGTLYRRVETDSYPQSSSHKSSWLSLVLKMDGVHLKIEIFSVVGVLRW